MGEDDSTDVTDILFNTTNTEFGKAHIWLSSLPTIKKKKILKNFYSMFSAKRVPYEEYLINEYTNAMRKEKLDNI